MRIFVAHSDEQKRTAELIYYSLETEGHKVFFDRASLPVGETFDERIRRAIRSSDLFIFLATSVSIDEYRYSMTELAIAREVANKKPGFIIAVLLETFAVVPEALEGCELLRPVGQPVPAVAHRVASFRARRRARLATILAMRIVVVTVIGLVGFIGYHRWFDERRILDRPSTIADAAATLAAAAHEKGYRSAELLSTWVIEPSLQPGTVTVSWTTVERWLQPRATAGADGTIVLGVYQRPQAIVPERRAAVLLNVGPTSLSKPYQPPTTSLGVALEPNTIEDEKDNPDVTFYHNTVTGWLLSLSPYLGSAPSHLHRWLCVRFPFYQRPSDPGTPPSVLTIHVPAVDCPVLDFLLPAPVNGPALAPPPQEGPTDTLRRLYSLPPDRKLVQKSEDAITIVYSSAGMATSAPMLLALLWVERGPAAIPSRIERAPAPK